MPGSPTFHTARRPHSPAPLQRGVPATRPPAGHTPATRRRAAGHPPQRDVPTARRHCGAASPQCDIPAPGCPRNAAPHGAAPPPGGTPAARRSHSPAPLRSGIPATRHPAAPYPRNTAPCSGAGTLQRPPAGHTPATRRRAAGHPPQRDVPTAWRPCGAAPPQPGTVRRCTPAAPQSPQHSGASPWRGTLCDAASPRRGIPATRDPRSAVSLRRGIALRRRAPQRCVPCGMASPQHAPPCGTAPLRQGARRGALRRSASRGLCAGAARPGQDLPHVLCRATDRLVPPARGAAPVGGGAWPGRYSCGSTPARSRPYAYASSSACQEAAITFSATPTVDHSPLPSAVETSTRVVDSVPCLPSRMRTL